MSNPDSFIEEVTEEVRRDRLFALIRRYGWIAVLLVLLLVGGAAYNEWRKSRETAEARALGDALYTALDKGDAEARIAALDAVEAPGRAAALKALLTAAEETAAGERAAAAERLAALSVNTEVPELYRQLAAIKEVSLRGDAQPAETRRYVLEPLAAPGQPFRLLAMEQLALIDVETGEREQAIARLNEILQASELSAGLRQRATQLMVALGGTPDGA
ncbi:hypothetical protein Ga0609869_000121 [Rhodovulum iodosum]|uniref:Tetratricopeptide repeat-like domain-containing protein n=1 Tax=Rhodovulum iodosum TaxID=68291 RepID=A0ABV3XN90_9RHOB|nr:hypothetical protein [Rhodovulum robiginosum]RSK35902.1 hypothetical protein EJA01_06035 [Rhodovulum robiginosum]